MWPRHCNGATGRGDFEMLSVLRAEECTWDAQACENGAMGGHLNYQSGCGPKGANGNREDAFA